jgi:hypothetical protein
MLWLVTQRVKRMHCHWLKQLQNAEYLRLSALKGSAARRAQIIQICSHVGDGADRRTIPGE